MATHGHLGEFDANKDDWKSYTERAKQYFAAKDIEEAAKKCTVLNSACGPATYRIIKDVLHPSQPSTVSFDTIVTKMSDYFLPVPNKIAQHCQFFSRIWRPHESISEYVAQIKQLAEYCKFGDTLDVMLWDRLVARVDNLK